MPVIDFDPPDRFVAGTVGPPGQRTFFLQASSGRRLVSVSLEKQQVSLLADRINDLLDDFAGGSATEAVAAEVEDNAPLDTPVEVDEEGDIVAPPGPEGEEPTMLRVAIAPAAARAFARRCASLFVVGRPPCPFCADPLDLP